jgi:hypothetical protein
MKSPGLHPLFGPGFTASPHFQWYSQSKDILLIWVLDAEIQHFETNYTS